jgi:DHA2 family multidrug resistance protein
MLGHINLGIGMRNIIIPVMINGLAMSFIFVPLTTSTMGMLRQEQMGNATGIFNLMRNLGGSIGIAAMTTLLARSTQSNQAALVAHLSPFNPVYQAKLTLLQSTLSSHGGAWMASKLAPRILYGVLLQQSALLGYISNFVLFGLICLCCSPLVFLFKKVVPAKGPVAMH